MNIQNNLENLLLEERILDEEIKNKLIKILEELPDENCRLDYKEIPYREEKYSKASFIKDICGFLNSSEAYGKDKFIILGIRNKTKEIWIRISLTNGLISQ